jgi:hypothetical protein
MTTKKIKKTGRPSLPKGEALDSIIPATRCKSDERAAFERHAQQKGLTLTQWVRQTLKEAIEQ